MSGPVIVSGVRARRDGHTPGPWSVVDRSHIRSASLGLVAVAQHGLETQANARLIASAPELLEALREAFNAFAHDADGPVWADSTIAKARAAIAKATGGAS